MTDDYTHGHLDTVEFTENTATIWVGAYHFLQITNIDPMYAGKRFSQNIRRLVACWNACDGIPTKDLKGYKQTIMDLGLEITQLRGKNDQFRELAKSNANALGASLVQRDMLLAALKALEEKIAVVMPALPECVRARAAIAKATGQEGGAV